MADENLEQLIADIADIDGALHAEVHGLVRNNLAPPEAPLLLRPVFRDPNAPPAPPLALMPLAALPAFLAPQPPEPAAPPEQPAQGGENRESEVKNPAPIPPVVEDADPILTPAGAEMKGFSCLICYECFNLKDRIPKMFSCGHTFCLSCMKELFNSRTYYMSNVNCPTCRHNTKFMNGSDHNKVPSNFSILSMLEQREEEKKAEAEKAETAHCFECQYYFKGNEVTSCNEELCRQGVEEEHLKMLDSIKRPKCLLICRDCIKEKHARHNYVSFETVVAQYEANKKIIRAERTLEKQLKFADDLIIQMGLLKNEVVDHRRRMVNAMENIRQEANHPYIYDYLARFKDSAKGSGDMFKRMAAEMNTFDRQSKARYYRAFGTDTLRPISRVPAVADLVAQPKQEPGVAEAAAERVRRFMDPPVALRNLQNGPLERAGELIAGFLPNDLEVDMDLERIMRAGDDLFGDFLQNGAALRALIRPAQPPAAPAPAPAPPAADPAHIPAVPAAPAAPGNPPPVNVAAENPPVPNAAAAVAPADPVANDPFMQLARGPIALGPFAIGGRRRRENQRNVREVHQELQNALIEHPFIGDVPAVRNAIAALEQMREVRDVRDFRDDIWNPLFPREFPRRRRHFDAARAPINDMDRQLQDAEARIEVLRGQIERLDRIARNNRRADNRERRRRPAPNPAGHVPWADVIVEVPLPERVVPPGPEGEQIMREDIDILVARVQGMVRNEAHADAALAGVRPPENIEMPPLLNPEAHPGVADFNDLQIPQLPLFLAQIRELERVYIRRGQERRARVAGVHPEERPAEPVPPVVALQDAPEPHAEHGQGDQAPAEPVDEPAAAPPAPTAHNDDDSAVPQEPITDKDARRRPASPSAAGPSNKRERLE